MYVECDFSRYLKLTYLCGLRRLFRRLSWLKRLRPGIMLKNMICRKIADLGERFEVIK
jgi:hypothetical protein